MPQLDAQQVFRGLRALLLVGLSLEVLTTVRYPSHTEQQADAYYTPAWRLNGFLGDASNKSETMALIHPGVYDVDGSPIYSSTKLLRRCQSVMQYNISSSQYETGPMSVWSSAEFVMASDPAAAWATWQEIIWTARNPWAAHWTSALVPESWHLMPKRMRHNLELLEQAVPVLIPDLSVTDKQQAGSTSSNDSSSTAGGTSNASHSRDLSAAAAAAAWWDTAPDAQLAVAATQRALDLSAVGNDSSRGTGQAPAAADAVDQHSSNVLRNSTTSSSVSNSGQHNSDSRMEAQGNESSESDDRSATADDGDSGYAYYEVRSHWIAHCTSAVNRTSLKPANTAFCTVTERGNATNIGGTFHIQAGGETSARDAERRLLGAGPASLSSNGLLWRLHGFSPLLVESCVLIADILWNGLVPLGNVSALMPLMRYLAVLELEFEWEVLAVYVIVCLAVFRNWMYLICVAYKVSRRLGLLGVHNFWDRLTGWALTFVGMLMAIWQNLGHAVAELAIDVLLMKYVVFVLNHSVHAAFWAWALSFQYGIFEVRAMVRAWKLAKSVWVDARNLVMNPQAMVLQQPAVLAERRNKVNTIGPWPGPLSIPDEIDDLPNADVPRGFICPITQAIMRQPALLLHDQTVTPSSYEKEAISEWLASHSTDPKTPGRKLDMKSVKLVYNGDLARAIEDWAAQTQQRNAAQRRQFSFVEQQLQAIRVRAQEALFHRQQQQPEGEGLQGDRAGVQPVDQQGPNPFAAAAAAAAMQVDGAGSPGPGSPTGQRSLSPAAAAAAADIGGTAAGTAAPSQAGSGSLRMGGTAGNIMRQSSAAIATMASLDIPTVATAGLAALADTRRRITTRAAARRLAQQQQHQQHQQPAAGPDSSGGSQHGLSSPFASPTAPGTGTANPASEDSSEDSPRANIEPASEFVFGSGSSDGTGPRRSLRVRRRTATPKLE